MGCRMNLFIKRLLDIILSFIGLIVLFPLFLVIAIGIKFDSKGPIFFKQKRRTLNGKIFEIYKFRSMCLNAEQQGTGLFNFTNDPRVTKVGKILRSTSLDELPQLLNVLKGELSLVGPRPCVVYELGEFNTLNKKYKKRFTMKAGITGLAQVKGRNENSWEEKVKYDNQYIELFKTEGILLDIKILFETILKVFKSKNIYEEKIDKNLNDIEAAQLAEEEIIRIAHLPDED